MIKELMKEAYETAKENGFWDMEDRIELKFRLEEPLDTEEQEFIKLCFIATKLMASVSELGEAFEGLRKGNMDGKDGVEEEISDSMIWLFDLCERRSIEIDKKLPWKMEYNKQRPIRHGKKL